MDKRKKGIAKTEFLLLILSLVTIIFILSIYNTNVEAEAEKYENSILGVKFSYPDYWGNSSNTDLQNGISSKDCFDRWSCYDSWVLQVNPPNSTFEYIIFGINRFNSENQMFLSECKCDTLTEFAQYRYEEEKQEADYFLFIKDDNITINNFPAFQIEYTNKEQSTNVTDLAIYTKVNNTFYEFGLSSDSNAIYSKYFPDVKKIIDSIEFIPVIKPVEKQPSFMMDTKDSNDTSPIANLTNEELQKYYQRWKEEINKASVGPSGNVPEETVKAMNEEFRKTGLEVVSTPEYIESFKELYNKTNGFTESTEMIGSFFRMTAEEVANRIIETTSFPQLKEMSIESKNKLKEVPYSELSKAFRMIIGLEPQTTYNYTEPQVGSLEEQLKLAQKKLEAAGVNGEFGVSREVPETKTEIEIDYKEVHKEIAELKILLKEIENKIYLLELELLS